MTTHIENTLTEVIAEPENKTPAGDGEDSRCCEQQKLACAIRRIERATRRLRAEGFDD